MKKSVLICVSYSLIALSFLVMAVNCRSIYDDCNIGDFIKRFYIYRENIVTDVLDPQSFLTIISSYLFTVYIIVVTFYGMSRKYRSMIMYRYTSRKNYFLNQFANIAKKCLSATIINCVVFVIVALTVGIRIYIAQDIIFRAIILLINQYTYFILIGFMNLCIVLKSKGTNGTIVCSLSTFFIIFVDACENTFAILTFGSLSQLVKGTILLLVITILTIITARDAIYKSDIL